MIRTFFILLNVILKCEHYYFMSEMLLELISNNKLYEIFFIAANIYVILIAYMYIKKYI